MTLKDDVIKECLDVLSREDVKEEFKEIMKPVIDMILKKLFPYIYISVLFVFISFLLILGIFVLLMRNKFLHKIL